MSTTNPTGEVALDPSAPAPVVSGAAQPTPEVITPERFNGVMSLYNKEQTSRQAAEAEVTRLQGLLADAVVSRQVAEQKATELEKGEGNKTQELEKKAGDLSATVAELSNKISQLTSTNARLAFLIDNQDVLPFRDALPVTDDIESLKRAAETFRTAMKQKEDQMRDHLIGTSRTIGGPGRTGGSQWEGADHTKIEAYLQEAIGNAAEFEKRLAEVTGGKSS